MSAEADEAAPTGIGGIFAHRIRLSDLPGGPRWLARAALAFAVLLAVLLMTTPLDLPLPGGLIEMQRSDHPTINRFVFAAVMIALAAALAAIGHAAGAGAIRRWRLALTGVAVIGLAAVPPEPFGFSPPWGVPLMLLGLGAGFALLVLVAIGIPRRPWIPTVLAAIPPLAGLTMVVTAGMFEPKPNGYTAAFFETYELTPIMTTLAATEAMFIVLGLWAAIEYGRGLAAGSTRFRELAQRWWVILPIALGAKALWLVVSSAGWLPSWVAPAQTAVTTFTREESWLSLVQAALFAAFIGWLLLRRHAIPHPEGAIRAALIVAVPLVGAFVLPQLGIAVDQVASNIGVRMSLFKQDPNAVPQLDAFVQFLSRSQDVLLAAAPAMAAYFAAAAGFWSLRRRGHTGESTFLLAFAAWTIVPATTWMLREGFGASRLYEGPAVGAGQEAIFGGVNPITLDLGLTVVVFLLSLAWWAGRQRVVTPPQLLAILVLSTLVSFGGGLAGTLGVVLFWLGLGFPLVVQFAFDARSLNTPSPGREGRVLASLGFALLIAATTLALISLGFVGPDHVGFEAFAKRLLLVPLVAVLAGAAIIGSARGDVASATP